MSLIITGVIAGIINGLFGSGAGMIILPFLLAGSKMDEVKARGTTLMSILFLTIISSIFYAKNISDFNFLWMVIAGGMLGGIIGAKTIKYIPAKWLRLALGAFMIITGIRMFFR